ncbi:hypothetical protein [Puniceibacterium sediminis]|nr:hypothetical protein [Puniceibacterium sediminis]
MSNPEVRTEPASVLSSIRRLLSNNFNSAPESPKVFDRLVLTPAQRVDQDGSRYGAEEPDKKPMLLTQALLYGAGSSGPSTKAAQTPNSASARSHRTSVNDMTLEQKIAALEEMISSKAAAADSPDFMAGQPGAMRGNVDLNALHSGHASPVSDENTTARAMPHRAAQDVLTSDILANANLEAPENVFADLNGGIDELMLRDLVADVVRQELQGVLGDRITRNVQKLVQREIQRTLVGSNPE